MYYLCDLQYIIYNLIIGLLHTTVKEHMNLPIRSLTFFNQLSHDDAIQKKLCVALIVILQDILSIFTW